MVTKLKIKKIAQKNPQTSVSGYNVRCISNGTITYTELAEDACKNTTINKSEARLAADLLMESICTAVMNGKIVDLGGVGKLYPVASTKWSATEAAITKDVVKTKVSFRPSDDVEAAIKGASLQWLNADDEEEDAGGSTPTDDDDQFNG